MIVLGLNGKLDGHDPAAALLVDGRLVAAVEEERLRRVKHAPNAMPHHAAAWCLAEAGIAVDDLDLIAYGWDPRRQPDAPEPADDAALRDLLLPPYLFPRTRNIALERVAHHQAHAAGAWACAPFQRAAVLVVDGSSERESVSLFRCERGALTLLWSLPFANSLGFFYEALTRFVGLGPYEEGKTMGLAPYGEPRFSIPSPLEQPPVAPVPEPDGNHFLDILRGWTRVLEEVSGAPRNPRPPRYLPLEGRLAQKADAFPQIYRDLAYAGQRRLEQDLLVLARRALAETGCADLVLAGGVAYNCVANGLLARKLGPHSGLFIQPAAGDAGVALGAAAEALAQRGQPLRLDNTHVYRGPRYSQGAVADLLSGWNVAFDAPPDPLQTLVDDLAVGRVVGFFHGRAEIGPRALGARSLLANPAHPGMLDRVNRIKGRESWRPLAPSLAAERAAEVFGAPLDSPFMLLSYPVLPTAHAAMAAAVHVDGSTRPQTVTTDSHPLFHSLLTRFAQQTGLPALLNTSFNIGEPIVATPAQALRTFMASGMDTLWIEGLIVRKGHG